MPAYINFPSGEALEKVINGFESKWGFPQSAGAIDGSHIPISAPNSTTPTLTTEKGGIQWSYKL